MNTIVIENRKLIGIVKAYYQAMLAKEYDTMASFLDEDVLFISPLAGMQGKESVIDAAINLSNILDDIQFKSIFSQSNQVMIAYDFIFSKMDLNLRSAGLLTIKNGLISSIELFYDGRPFTELKDAIFRD